MRELLTYDYYLRGKMRRAVRNLQAKMQQTSGLSEHFMKKRKRTKAFAGI